MTKKRVVILGGGFAGLRAARALRSAPVSITLIDRRNHHLFQPLLYQVASAALDPSDIAYPIRAAVRGQRNVDRVLLAEATGIGPGAVQTDIGDVPYDWLIVATGATHSYFGRDDWAAHAPGLKTIEDALDIRRRVLSAFEHAERDPEQAQDWLTFVVVGAGPTGVEMAGALMELGCHTLVRDFKAIEPRNTRVVLVEGADRVLPPYPAKLSASAQRQLESLGVEVRAGQLVTELDEAGVTLKSGERIAARTVLWAAGVQASPLGKVLGAELDRAGRVKVAPDLSLPHAKDVFVAGDLASVESNGQPVPGVAPAAIQMGLHAAKCIRADLAGKERTPFSYRDKGSLATIGRARAVADLNFVQFSGFSAWLAWMGIHVAFLIGFRNRLFVLLSWAWSYITFRRGARLITGDGEPGDRGEARPAPGGQTFDEPASSRDRAATG